MQGKEAKAICNSKAHLTENANFVCSFISNLNTVDAEINISSERNAVNSETLH